MASMQNYHVKFALRMINCGKQWTGKTTQQNRKAAAKGYFAEVKAKR